MKSVADQAKEYIELAGVWVNGGELERMTFITEKKTSAKPSNISKRLRELSADGKIEKKIENGSVWYHAKMVEVVEHWRDGELVSRTANGQPMAVIAGIKVNIFAAPKEKQKGLF